MATKAFDLAKEIADNETHARNIADAQVCIRHGKGKAQFVTRLANGGSRWTFANVDYCADFVVWRGEIVEPGQAYPHGATHEEFLGDMIGFAW